MSTATHGVNRASRFQAMMAVQDKLWRVWMVVSPTFALSVMRPWEQLFATLLLTSIAAVAAVMAAKLTAYTADSLYNLAVSAATVIVHISRFEDHANLSKSFRDDAAPWIILQSWS
ncbi:hypothetical protein PANT_15d00027 [Moesziomyces antarcticus T-34]|uniref:Uncharacterized protein n=1 Tax=Pseudozyma antarctica (strain T-34) TaxID=1151754 RepID=M9LR40_PSEA3|nr:hypothetical protein PANT_15d00027 [Moesziomyces antarcticus T-34]